MIRAKPARRTDALSRERIVEAAIAILDEHGETALTFRALSASLSTGSGAIYWHVADKNALMAAVTDHIMAAIGAEAEPQQAIRTLAQGVFDAIDAHPWIGAQLSRDPWQPAVLRLLEGIGSRVQALGVPRPAQFHAATALMSFILGLAGQYAAGARLIRQGHDRETMLRKVADSWMQLDPASYPFVQGIAAELPGHDDREQFLAGIDLILAGIESSIS